MNFSSALPASSLNTAEQQRTDRRYAVVMVRQHAAQARSQDLLRTLWVIAAVGLASMMLVGGLIVPQRLLFGHRWVIGLAVCAISAVGALMMIKHSERYDLHTNLQRTFQGVLREGVRMDISKSVQITRLQHDRTHNLAQRLNLQTISLVLLTTLFLACGGMAWELLPKAGGDEISELLHVPGAARPAQPQIAAQTGGQTATGSYSDTTLTQASSGSFTQASDASPARAPEIYDASAPRPTTLQLTPSTLSR